MRVLLVEDEITLATAIASIFEKNNIITDIAHNGIDGQRMADTDVYDVLILDIMLPGKSGLDILSHIRRQGKNVPVLLLTAKDTTADKVKGLNMGADDYLVKPFVTEELIARVRALGRRPWEVYPDDILRFADLELDPSTGELKVGKEKEIVKLTVKENRLMEMFMRNPGATISKEMILERIWGEGKGMDNSVEIYVHYLRKKTQSARAKIKTLRGLGYSIQDIES